MDYYIRLTNFYHQFQSIGNNYNQTVKAVKTNFGEKRAFVLLRNLEKATIDLVLLSKRIILLTREFEEEYLIKGKGGGMTWWLNQQGCFALWGDYLQPAEGGRCHRAYHCREPYDYRYDRQPGTCHAADPLGV